MEEKRTFISRLKHGWNAFAGNRDPTEVRHHYGESYSRRPDRVRFTSTNARTIAPAIYNRIAMDGAAIDIRHVRLDDNGRYKEDVKSGLNDCFTIAANIDQTARAFKQDIIMSMLDEGCVAIVPIETTMNPKVSGSYDITSMRTGRVVDWYPKHVKIKVYNERTGRKEDIIMPKSTVTIVENPLYAVINESNSVMQRLIRKLSLLDAVEELRGSGKLDLIVQLPYVVKTDARREQVRQRMADIESQLRDSPFGIAYTDGTERVTQLNRPIENNLMKQIEYLTNMLYSQLGITQAVMDGTADEKTMLNYYNRTIEPIVAAIVEGMHRTFLTKTARSQKQAIRFFRDPFKLVPINDIAEIADKFTRNEIMTSNEIRQIVGMKPADDPKADRLINSNMPQEDTGMVEDPAMTEADGSEEIAPTESGNSVKSRLQQLMTMKVSDL